ncbi:hypothetical protein COR50_07045 [Chitinophaga caeni]|uniref:DUF695 domain-containing protein n=1 Tax=Chitinophaga caeni TaxID=2029983 RepID=A0A291QSL3_9BACT|nr:DUF695 domain-containing protein [Chitinophaga caeni]ATL46958.1 hypothetical protein COR50_07045 [Chitinophaga caeni]
MLRRIFLFVLLICSISTFAQEKVDSSKGKDIWDTYVAEYTKGLGSVMYNQSLKKIAPISSMPYMLMVGVNCKTNDGRDLPTPEEIDQLYAMSDTITTVIKRQVKLFKLAGSRTYHNQRYDYYYVSDTAKLQDKIAEAFHEKFHYYKFHIKFKNDPGWNGYLNFLYPSATILEFKQNNEIIARLRSAGDHLDIPRNVMHFLRFKEVVDREKFEELVKEQGFDVKVKLFDQKNLVMPFRICISREDPVSANFINPVTVMLRKLAARCNGEYEFWQSPVVN